jgi:hypothetical protein
MAISLIDFKPIAVQADRRAFSRLRNSLPPGCSATLSD